MKSKIVKLSSKQLRSLIENVVNNISEDNQGGRFNDYKTIPAPRPDSAYQLGGNMKGDVSKVKNWHRHAAEKAIDSLEGVVEILDDQEAAQKVLNQLRKILKA
jgi:hypothetical protein